MANIIEIENLFYTYLPGSHYEHQALRDVSFTLAQGEFLGIFGPNSSGKSTLAKHLNGLLYPTAGTVTICGADTRVKASRSQLWKKVGLVFQYPEQQIFEATVYDEIAYGLRNMGISEPELKNRIFEALEKIGLSAETVMDLSPFNLSGGMRRRIAIAGILALRPEILVLDEPMAGLDPIGRQMVLDIIKRRQESKNETTVMISHDLKEVLELADKIAILDQGALFFFGKSEELLADVKITNKFDFELPAYLQVVQSLAAKGVNIKNIKNLNDAGREIIKALAENSCRSIYP